MDSMLQNALMKGMSYRDNDTKVVLRYLSKYTENIPQLDQIAFLQSQCKDFKGSVNTLLKLQFYPEINTNKEARKNLAANLSKMLNKANQPQDSILVSKQYIEDEHQNMNHDFAMEHALSYHMIGDYEKSKKLMQDIADDRFVPENIRERVLYNLGFHLLEENKFKEGYRCIVDIGHKIGIWPTTYVPNIPVWNGDNDPSKLIIVHAEGGIGDEILLVRFLRIIEQRGMRVAWVTNNRHLEAVFKRNGYSVAHPSELESYDPQTTVQCMAMSLPILLNLDKDDLWFGTYLSPAPEYVEKWDKILPKEPLLGVKWSGNPEYEQDLHRSIPIDNILAIKWHGAKVNLQLEDEFQDQDFFSVNKYIENIEDTLAILSLCQYTVTSCTSIAHMAGAIGARVKVCPPIACYHVWLGDIRWYGQNTEVYRQRKHNDWDFVKLL